MYSIILIIYMDQIELFIGIYVIAMKNNYDNINLYEITMEVKKYYQSILIHPEFIRSRESLRKSVLLNEKSFAIPDCRLIEYKHKDNVLEDLLYLVKDFVKKNQPFLMVPIFAITNKNLGLDVGLYCMDIENEIVFQYKNKIESNINTLINKHKSDIISFIFIDMEYASEIYAEVGLIEAILQVGKFIQFIDEHTEYKIATESLLPQALITRELDVNITELFLVTSALIGI